LSTLTANSFELLLTALDPDQMQAAVKYETLRSKLTHILMWRGCSESDADELADRTLDRVAGKLAEGETVENLPAYSASVARFIWLEHSRRKKEDAVGDDMPEVAVDPDVSVFEEPDRRTECLRDCMAETIPNPTDRRIIIGYYDTETNEKNKHARKRLADSLDITVNALKVRACRLREKLERCVNDCLERSSVQQREVIKR
jgi:DNA-directed RNA polymerase specialized sigma24 family protein